MCNMPQFFPNVVNPWTGQLYPVPCHHCKGCRIDRRTMWTQRIMSEYVKFRCAFVTFTYDDYHLRYNPGAVYPTLRADDFSKYIDVIRHKINTFSSMPPFCSRKWKYVAVGEYGEKTKYRRPHYHALFLGLDWLYFKDFFKKSWKHGMVDVGPIMRGGIQYVLKYMDKQVNGPLAHSLFTDFGREIPTFMFSPGIGKDWFLSQLSNINKYGMAKVGQRLIPIPSYWKNKLFNYCETNIYDIQKRNSERIQELDSQFRSLGYDSYDSYLRSARKFMERRYEILDRRNHIPSENFSDMISSSRLPPFSELVLNYRSFPILQKLVDRPNVFA